MTQTHKQKQAEELLNHFRTKYPEGTKIWVIPKDEPDYECGGQTEYYPPQEGIILRTVYDHPRNTAILVETKIVKEKYCDETPNEVREKQLGEMWDALAHNVNYVRGLSRDQYIHQGLHYTEHYTIDDFSYYCFDNEVEAWEEYISHLNNEVKSLEEELQEKKDKLDKAKNHLVAAEKKLLGLAEEELNVN